MRSTVAAVVLVALTARQVSAQALAGQRFNYNDLPDKVDTSSGERGPQLGTNRCGPDTEGPDSLCQTAIINAVDDFCLWAPPTPGEEVGNIEGHMVAYCTRPGRGARTIPAGALKGVQFIKTPHYVQVTGLMDQTMINMLAGDTGGEMDAHGADQRGNPIGGLVFTNQFGSSGGSPYTQIVNWHNFMGSNVFCLKACTPTWDFDYRMCEHVYDRSGCAVNAPAAYREGVFESCLGDDQLAPGVYVGANGVTSTWTQPPEGTPVGELPYVPQIPATSQCTAYQSAELYNGRPVDDNAGPVATSLASSVMSGSASASVSGSVSASVVTSEISSAPSSMVSSEPSSALPSSEPSSSPSSMSSIMSSMASSTAESSSSETITLSSTPSVPVVTQLVTDDQNASAAAPPAETTGPSSGAMRVATTSTLALVMVALLVSLA
ncbi:hypothetical protein OIO90_000596 [Microbotryomycetes sp. JL221]|nr:hypothetical protein OIO90_000596 [Microbotryomycetes sp. JL221]